MLSRCWPSNSTNQIRRPRIMVSKKRHHVSFQSHAIIPQFLASLWRILAWQILFYKTIFEALCWILANNHSIHYLIHLLDDFLIVSPRHSPLTARLRIVRRDFSELGIPIAPKKTEGLATFLEFLEIRLNSVKFQALLPKEKIDRISNVINNHTLATRIFKCDFLSLLGHLNFAMRIVPQGRPFISHILSSILCPRLKQFSHPELIV